MDDAFFRLFQQHGAGISRGAAIESPYIARGSWTPTIQGTATPGTYTYSIQAGAYILIEEYCFVVGQVAATAVPVAPTGNIQIAGLPVTATSVGASSFGGHLYFGAWQGATLGGGYTQLSARIIGGTAAARLIQSGSAAAIAAIGAAAFGLVGGLIDLEFAGYYKYA